MDMEYTTSDSENDQDYMPCLDCLEMMAQKEDMIELLCQLKMQLVQEKKKVFNLEKKLKTLQSLVN